MGKRGPQPEPVPLKVLKGRSPGHDIAGKPIPQIPPFERGEPVMPDCLTPEAREEWDRIVPMLVSLDILKPEDCGTLTARCMAWSRAVRAEATLAAEGQTITNPSSGHEATHPCVTIAAAAWRDVVRFGAQLGLDPASEISLAAPAREPVDNDDPFAWAGNS